MIINPIIHFTLWIISHLANIKTAESDFLFKFIQEKVSTRKLIQNQLKVDLRDSQWSFWMIKQIFFSRDIRKEKRKKNL